MSAKTGGLAIPLRLTPERAAIVLACLNSCPVAPAVHKQASDEQRALFVELSKSFERKWPERYQLLVEGEAFPHWRAYLIDKMNDTQLRETAMRAVASCG